MSKGKDFRPRKRGFDDDDGPSGYEPRNRPMRQPFGGGFDAPMGGMAPPPMAAGPTPGSVDATVKWFKGDKGFGFVELSNGAGDAFLHIGALQSAGYESVPPGSKMKVLVTQGMKGAQVSRVLEVDTSTAQEPRPRFEGGGGGGFGGGDRFVASDDGGKDVFVHISVLRPAGIQSLVESQAVQMRVVDTPKGREAISISLR